MAHSCFHVWPIIALTCGPFLLPCMAPMYSSRVWLLCMAPVYTAVTSTVVTATVVIATVVIAVIVIVVIVRSK